MAGGNYFFWLGASAKPTGPAPQGAEPVPVSGRAASPLRKDQFDCFRRAYVRDMLDEAADALPPKARREFRKFLRSLDTGEVG